MIIYTWCGDNANTRVSRNVVNFLNEVVGTNIGDDYIEIWSCEEDESYCLISLTMDRKSWRNYEILKINNHTLEYGEYVNNISRFQEIAHKTMIEFEYQLAHVNLSFKLQT